MKNEHIRIGENKQNKKSLKEGTRNRDSIA